MTIAAARYVTVLHTKLRSYKHRLRGLTYCWNIYVVFSWRLCGDRMYTCRL